MLGATFYGILMELPYGIHIHTHMVSIWIPHAMLLGELRDKLAIANEYANVHLANQEKTWVNRYNLHSKNKQFHDGQAVMILSADSISSRLWSHWRALAKIIS
jgi:hypothetical protein